MPDTSPTPADQLRAAADLLRAASTAAADHSGSSVWQSTRHFPDQPDSDFTTLTAGPGRPLHKGGGGGRGVAPYMHAPVSEYAALMGPGVGLALAAWLERAAVEYDATVRGAAGVWSESGEERERDAWVERQTNRHALAVARQLLGTTSETTAVEELEPIQLRWGLDDVMYGDDDTTTVLLSGPGRAPYWLELDPERTAALRDALAGPVLCLSGEHNHTPGKAAQ
ncbi:hypothetical protein ACFY8V_32740 [Streptomyces californicus]|uniref:hypothetical protein n=1 Tax=Streptomyces californicus TaxID=67351 RepID=UPI0036D10563